MEPPVWLIAYDFSAPARAAAKLGAEEAMDRGGSLLLMHTFVEPHVPGSYKWARSEGFENQDALYNALVEEITEALDEVARDLREAHPDLHVETLVNRGDPRDLVPRVAEERGVFRIVIGTHGRVGLDRYLLGSVAEEVVRAAHTPVIVVKAADGDTDD
jgi:nucleotide-binding universal stress UspA family protein